MAPAVFFDGRSNRRRVVALVFADRLEIAEADNSGTASGGAPLASWAYDAIRRADGPTNTLRLTCTAALPLARLELRDPADRARILLACKALDGPGGVAAVSAWRIAGWSLATAAAILGMAWFGMPLLADRLSASIPYAWEAPIGAALDPQLRGMFGTACEAPEGVAALRLLVARLQTVARLPIAPEPVVLRSTVPNAFAIPGGRVYVLSALLAAAATPDEFAGILAHELGHVSHRDGLRRLIRDGGTSFLVGLMFGDVTGAGAVLVAGRAVLSAAYSRADEEAADAFAVTVMHGLGRPTAPTGALLQRITGPDEAQMPQILRDHPLTPDRKAMLQAEDAAPTGPALLGAAQWQALRGICDR